MIFVDDVAMRSTTDQVIDGSIRLGGGYGLSAASGDHDLEGIVETGRFESPALDEIFRLAVGEGFAEWWRGRRPEGDFEGRFSIASGRERSVHAELQPSSFTIQATPGAEETRGGGAVRAGGTVRVDDDQVRIGPLELVGDRDTTCRFTFDLRDFDALKIKGQFRLDAPDSRVPELGFLTPPFSNVVGPSMMTTGGSGSAATSRRRTAATRNPAPTSRAPPGTTRCSTRRRERCSSSRATCSSEAWE